MRQTKRPFGTHNQKGFTFVEVIIVIGILALLSAIAIGEYYYRRQKAFDRQALAVAKNLLTLSATAFANDEIPTQEGFTEGTAPKGYPGLEVNPGISTLIDAADDGSDVWTFYVASDGGTTAYFFWLPGVNCTETAVKGKPSDTIVENEDHPAEDWRGPAFLDV